MDVEIILVCFKKVYDSSSTDHVKLFLISYDCQQRQGMLSEFNTNHRIGCCAFRIRTYLPFCCFKINIDFNYFAFTYSFFVRIVGLRL